MSAVSRPSFHGREVLRCECGLIQFPTKDGKCRKVSCRLPFDEIGELKAIPRIPVTAIPWRGCDVVKALPHVLRALRQAAGMSQKQLAAKLRHPRTWVSKLENLKATPGITWRCCRESGIGSRDFHYSAAPTVTTGFNWFCFDISGAQTGLMTHFLPFHTIL